MSNIIAIPTATEHKNMALELKSLDPKGTFEGYGSIFGNKDQYGDVVTKGAFADSLKATKSQGVKLLWQHDTAEPIGVYDDVHEDDKGLYVKGTLLIDDVARAREAYALLKAGAIDGLSIGFTINPGGSEYNKNGTIRYLNSLSLWEISVVTFPANTRALVANVKEKNMEDIKSVRDFENFLRDAGGYSKAQAVAIANHGYVKGLQRDADVEDDDAEELQQKQFADDILKIMAALKQGVKNL